MTGGLAWQDEYGLCTSCQQRPPYWGAVCQPCGVALGVGSWADGPNQPQPVGWRMAPAPEQAVGLMVAEQAEPVGWVMPRNVVTATTAAWRATASRDRWGGNTTFHSGGVIRAPGGGVGTNTVRVRCSLCGAIWVPDLTIGGCPCCHGDQHTAETVRAQYAAAQADHRRRLQAHLADVMPCCGGLTDRGHTTTCPDHGIWMETEPTRPAWPVIRPPQRHMPAKARAARPRRSLARLAGSVGDSTGVGLLATWISWLIIPRVGYVHAVHLSLIILTAAATILTVAAMCGYGRNSRED